MNPTQEDAIIEHVEKFCHNETKDYPDESHNVDHHRAVDWNTRIIARSVGITSTIVIIVLRIAALVHDIVDHKYCSPKLAGQPTLKEKQRRLDDFLKSIPEIKEWVPRIQLWISNMSFSKEKNHGIIEMSEEDMFYRNILSDADKWEALGPIGLQRCKEYHRMLNPNITEETLNEEVIEHIEEKILILHKYCRTPLGIQHALELTKPVKEWYLIHKK